ncbi:alpha/beta fold hydrolase [Streptomyces tendae]|uniref:alpha/beta fold hydrolase n=1 Tax=Streptomyces tendae TaxID=1932 RepID=UPI0013304CEB|nr:alpha/beta hydrolase [Streptomyces tendae]
MPTFDAPDGTRLAYHRKGSGGDRPLVCVPGGPMMRSAYFGDLGGLAARRELVLLDLRGTGDSAEPADLAGFRVDRQAEDIEALRVTLGLEQLDLLGHSAAGDLVLAYAARHPERVRSLVLVCARARTAGIDFPVERRREALELRRDEPWYEEVRPAFERAVSGEAGEADFELLDRLSYGRWDAAAQAHAATCAEWFDEQAASAYLAPGAFDAADAARAVLAGLDAPVLVLSGALDGSPRPDSAAEVAALFPHGEHVVQTNAAHNPWVDGPDDFVGTVAEFLARDHR